MTIPISTIRKFETSKTWERFLKTNKNIIDADIKEISRVAKTIKKRYEVGSG